MHNDLREDFARRVQKPQPELFCDEIGGFDQSVWIMRANKKRIDHSTSTLAFLMMRSSLAMWFRDELGVGSSFSTTLPNSEPQIMHRSS